MTMSQCPRSSFNCWVVLVRHHGERRRETSAGRFIGCDYAGARGGSLLLSLDPDPPLRPHGAPPPPELHCKPPFDARSFAEARRGANSFASNASTGDIAELKKRLSHLSPSSPGPKFSVAPWSLSSSTVGWPPPRSRLLRILLRYAEDGP